MRFDALSQSCSKMQRISECSQKGETLNSVYSAPWQCRKQQSWGDAGLKFSLGGGGGEDGTSWIFFQTHRCCWILVSQHKVGAGRGELFILWGQPLYLQPRQATASLIRCVWCCCRFQGRTARNVSRTAPSEAGVGDALNSRRYQRRFLLFYVFGFSLQAFAW